MSSIGTGTPDFINRYFISALSSKIYLECSILHSFIMDDKNEAVFVVISPTTNISFDLIPFGIKSNFVSVFMLFDKNTEAVK